MRRDEVEGSDGMKLSVVIPCYNAAETLAVQLEALTGQQWTEPWEVILANNRSTDDSLRIARTYQARMPNLRIVEASARQGQPFAMNSGAEAAAGESLAFCDADDEVAPGWVAALGEALQQHTIVACRFDTAKLNVPWLYRSRANPQQSHLIPYRYPPYLPHAGGGGLGVRRELFRELNGFDETLPYLHDTDFCWRAQLRGQAIAFVPEAVLHVRFRESLSSIYRQARAYAEYNVLLYKRYRAHGMPRLGVTASLPGWRDVLWGALWLRSKEDAARWLWDFGWRVGRIHGSLKHRTFAL